MTSEKSIRQLIQDLSDSFTPSERKLVRLLTGSNPVIALGSIHQFAEHAKVSAPTVLRFAVKLGYSGFPEFQKAWLNELESMLTSPLALIDHRDEEREDTFGRVLGRLVEQGIEEISRSSNVITLLSDVRRRVYVRGGRFSQPLAEYLFAHLREIRGNAELLGRNPGQDLDVTVDISKKDVLFLFDYRRYQADTIHLGKQASQQGAAVILFTDKWLSPAAEYAQHIVVSDIASGSAYDTLVPAMAQVEYLAMQLLKALGEKTSQRLRRLEAVRDSAKSES
ncbi:MurR/RpiR family transcriptional regulator [Pseudomonas sp. JM0905a]|uniref:MurR/RpiR family transcriptional regulator n=1 Tax=Pseudomonas sp. JM0905a TaxID=2772484 RepID=UPI001683E8B9|nr:MurR/RpiR family transcriptional regulator [Pseudomonas sp. JM0905a]MBD2837809.1 MurR/RpiR family transcriptional regulator [Pseudomonas sp. JM0905a]